MSIRSELFADHELGQRLDSGGAVEFYKARPLNGAQSTHLSIRFPVGDLRWPPWAWPVVSTYIVSRARVFYCPRGLQGFGGRLGRHCPRWKSVTSNAWRSVSASAQFRDHRKSGLPFM